MTTDTSSKMDAATAKRLKAVSLITLTGQNALLGLSMRYSRTRDGDMFFEATAVLMAEIFKLVTCLFLVFNDEGRDANKYFNSLYQTIWVNKVDTLKVCIPSMIYLIQNNLLYVAAENLDVGTYQITYQLKILTTAIFAVIILNKTLLKTQWLSLVVLICGVAMVQLSDSKETSVTSVEQDRVKGFVAALTSSVLSGLAGIYFEKILKGSDVSVWMRNVQLSMLSIPLGVFVSFLKHGQQIEAKGFFFGYDLFVWYLVALNALGGLIVAVVVKYADNILKGFACSMAIIITCIVSVFLFGFILNLQFVCGASLVVAAVFLYGYQPPKPDAKKANQSV